MIQVFLYLIAFIMGTLLGSFCTLAVYRIPLKMNITHERSFCVKCNHKLGFIDLIPVFSYIFLGGKCRYCGEKIRPRYLLLEIFFGLSYMFFIMSMNFNIYEIDINKLVYVFFGTLYLVTLFIIAGIDKEYIKVQKSVLLFGLISLATYMVYLYVVQANIYRYVICLLISLILFIIEKYYFKKDNNYILQLLSLIFFMIVFTNQIGMIFTILVSLIIIVFMKFIQKKEINKIPVAFLMCSSNIFCIIIGLGV